VGDVDQVLIDQRERCRRSLDAELLVDLRVAGRGGAADGDEDDRPATALAGEIVEEVDQPVGLERVELDGAGLEEQRDLPRALLVR